MPVAASTAITASYSYFPGCSLHSTGLEYNQSVLAVFAHLGLDLIEMEGWNCCGASSAHAVDQFLALALPARNLVIAQESNRHLAVPCAACFNRMKSVQHHFEHNPESRTQVLSALNVPELKTVPVRHILGILYEDFGAKRLAAQIRHPLKGLKVAAYYGCLLVRPPEVVQFDDPEHPHIMPELLTASGAEVVSWSDMTECCGGSLSLSRADIVYHLVGSLANRAHEAGAQALVTACPLCQVNLEMRQGKGKTGDSVILPVFYFTELIGLALGLEEAPKWWAKHLIDPRPLLDSLRLL
jgi:heterodisulfide reductase subunit B